MVDEHCEASIEMEAARLTQDEMVAQLLSMGFDYYLALEVISNPNLGSLNDMVDFLLTEGSSRYVECCLGKRKNVSNDLEEIDRKNIVNPNDGSCNLWHFKEEVKENIRAARFVCSNVKVEPMETSSILCRTDAMKTSTEFCGDATEQMRENGGTNNQGFWVQEGAWGGFSDEVFDEEEPPLHQSDAAEENIITHVVVPSVPRKKLVIGHSSEVVCKGTTTARSRTSVLEKYSTDIASKEADMQREEMLIRCQKAMRVKGELVDAESAVDVKPVIENKHVLNFGGKLNPAVDTGSTGAKAEPLETEDVKPRGSELPRNRCREEQENCTQVKRKRGSILDPDGLREGGPSKTYIPSKLKGVTIPKVEDWEKAAVTALRRYFGYQELKSFQRIAIEAWADNRDCFVLAATGSGKSLCFQLPALMTGKVVVVVSPLISLMHDQCLQLARQGVSACFLGSGQVDKTIELKAMAGIYNIVYVCPETLPRLESCLQSLARGKGIALFAVDEAHCISK